MHLKRLITALFLSLCSTAIMSYITMATPIGPWIETTIVLAAMVLFTLIIRNNDEYVPYLGLTTAAAGIGGILATGAGFSFPTLYFIDKPGFDSLISNPLSFCLVLGFIGFSAGAFGLVIAELCESKFIVAEKLPFPIGELIYKMISAQDQARKAVSLVGGFIGTLFFLAVRTVQNIIHNIIIVPQNITLPFGIKIPSLTLPLDLLPMFLAIGFITGHVIALPLLCGLIVKYFCIDPLYYFYEPLYNFVKYFFALPFLPAFKQIPVSDFTVAFSSGIVLYSALTGLLELPKMLYTYSKQFYSNTNEFKGWTSNFIKGFPWVQLLSVIAANMLIMTYFKFTLLSQVYLLIFTFICTYQMLYIAGKIGMAPLGRFATFVLVPSLFLFQLTPLQITFIATYVEIAGGVACDTLFGRKMAYLASFDHKDIVRYQWLGLLVSCLTVGIIFWFLISSFGLGTEPGALAVNRAVNRALLLNCTTFDFFVLGLGLLFGYMLSFTKVSPVLILGGILMQPSYSIMLILGGLLALLVKNKEDYYPAWSGIFAANSLWMIVKALIK